MMKFEIMKLEVGNQALGAIIRTIRNLTSIAFYP
jgi:hypothetical protein